MFTKVTYNLIKQRNVGFIFMPYITNDKRDELIKKVTVKYRTRKLLLFLVILLYILLISLFITCFILSSKQYEKLANDGKEYSEIYEILSEKWYSLINIKELSDSKIVLGFSLMSIILLSVFIANTVLAVVALILLRFMKSPTDTKQTLEKIYTTAVTERNNKKKSIAEIVRNRAKLEDERKVE